MIVEGLMKWGVRENNEHLSDFGSDKTNYFEKYLSTERTHKELAGLLHQYDELVVFLNGTDELGPRSLGNRSILSSASSTDIKRQLNEMKKREEYRPVAPTWLEKAPRILIQIPRGHITVRALCKE